MGRVTVLILKRQNRFPSTQILERNSLLAPIPYLMAVPLSESATVLRKRFGKKKCIHKCYQGQTGTFLFLFFFCFLLFLTGFDPSFVILGNVTGRSCNFETSCFLLPFRSFFFKVTSAISDSNLLLLGGDPVSLILNKCYTE